MDADKKEPMKKAKGKAKTKTNEGAEEEATLVMASKDMVDRITGWMEDTAEMQTESMLELADKIRDEMGVEKSEEFTGSVKPALESLYSALESTRDSLTTGVAILTGEGAPTTMGDEVPDDDMDMEPTTDMDMDDTEADDPAGDEFAASDAGVGGEEEADREKRESLDLSRRLGLLLADSKKKGLTEAESYDNLAQILHLKLEQGATSIGWDELNTLLQNVGAEQFNRDSFVEAFNSDTRVRNLVNNFDEAGVTLKGGQEPKQEPEDKTVDKMADRATANALK